MLDAITARGLDVGVVAYLKTPSQRCRRCRRHHLHHPDTTPDAVIIARPPTVAEAFLDSL